mmetsp:Transcript_4046/g.6896  ORF Transcript_4046/g.6896 Transcript_4046/m.6896 type:complete len:207 (-) Transcript_4046:71-691(-)
MTHLVHSFHHGCDPCDHGHYVIGRGRCRDACAHHGHGGHHDRDGHDGHDGHHGHRGHGDCGQQCGGGGPDVCHHHGHDGSGARAHEHDQHQHHSHDAQGPDSSDGPCAHALHDEHQHHFHHVGRGHGCVSPCVCAHGRHGCAHASHEHAHFFHGFACASSWCEHAHDDRDSHRPRHMQPPEGTRVFPAAVAVTKTGQCPSLCKFAD